MQTITKIGVLPADAREQRTQFGVAERTSKRNRSAGNPCGEDEWGTVQTARHDVGIDEDPGSDDAADDDHRSVESAERTIERHDVEPIVCDVFSG
jgi:hypothetical protein